MENQPMPGNLVALRKRHLHSQVTQKLLLEERMLAIQIRQLTKQRQEIRNRIRRSLDQGAKCERGFRTAQVETRFVLTIR